MKKLILLLLFAATRAAFAQDSSVIDLGELKVKGEIRRPSISFYQLKALHDSQLQELSEVSFNDFEKELLTAKKETQNESH